MPNKEAIIGRILRPDRKRITALLLLFILAGPAGISILLLPGILAATWVFGVGIDASPNLPGWYQYPVFVSMLLINAILWYVVVSMVIFLWENKHPAK
jgi:hypothetical protein